MKSRAANMSRAVQQARFASQKPLQRNFVASAQTQWRASASFRQQQQEQGQQQSSQDQSQSQRQQQQQKKQEAEPELQPGKSPFAAFVEVVKEEIERNRQLQADMKQLGGKVDSMADSKAWGAVRNTYERARLASSIQENPRLRKAAEELVRTGGKVNDAIAEAVTESHIYRGLSKGAAAAYAASEPIRQTELYKAVASSVDDVLKDVRYGGFVDKEARRRRRQARLAQIGKEGGMAKQQRRKAVKVEENPEAGENIVVHETANVAPPPSFAQRVMPESMSNWLSGVNENYQNSENPFVSSLRAVTSTVGRVFEETETAKVARMFKELDPTFQQEQFLNELREYIVPEIVDALVSADLATLKQWLSEAPMSVVTHGIQTAQAAGLVSDSRVLDIRGVDLVKAQVLENEIPVFVIAFHTQEILCYRNPKNGEVVMGADDRVKNCGYVSVLTRVEAELDNEETGGWKVIDMARREQ